jgi:uncharacterized LabA/DUF88 family protein
MKKVSIYIDGSNLYFSAKNKFNSKLDIKKLCDKLSSNYELVDIKYYIAPIQQSSNEEMYAQQQSFFDKLREIPKLKIIFGRLEKRKREGKVYYVEKATDVNLALDLVLDAQRNLYDKAFLISNDGDFSGAVKGAVERFSKEITYVAIGNNRTISHHLKNVASNTLTLTEKFVKEMKID